MTKNIIYIDDMNFAHITTSNGRSLVTCRMFKGGFVRIDDGRTYPQLCAGVKQMGATLSFESPSQLARDCNAELFLAREDYDAAVEKMKSEASKADEEDRIVSKYIEKAASKQDDKNSRIAGPGCNWTQPLSTSD